MEEPVVLLAADRYNDNVLEAENARENRRFAPVRPDFMQCRRDEVLIEAFCRDWWVASTAFPLIAATIGPLANVLSIASLATPWRVKLLDNGQLPLGVDDSDLYIDDPHW